MLQNDHFKFLVLTSIMLDLMLQVIWRKLSDPFPLTVGTTRFWNTGKYRVKRRFDDWELTIKNLRYSDAGEYECKLSGENKAQILSLIIPGEI